MNFFVRDILEAKRRYESLKRRWFAYVSPETGLQAGGNYGCTDNWEELYVVAESELVKLKAENATLRTKLIVSGVGAAHAFAEKKIHMEEQETFNKKSIDKIRELGLEKANLQSQLTGAIRALEAINREELNAQRPGGGYSRSAVISYAALTAIKNGD